MINFPRSDNKNEGNSYNIDTMSNETGVKEHFSIDGDNDSDVSDESVISGMNEVNVNEATDIITNQQQDEREDEPQDEDEHKKREKRRKILDGQERIARDRKRHPFLPPCNCSRECVQCVNELERKRIHSIFWTKDYNERKCYMFSRIKPVAVSRRRKVTNGEKIRKKTYQYTVEVDGIGVKVCQVFFLRTLGFKSHRVLLTVMQTAADDIIPQPDARGKRPSVNKIAVENIEFIRSHIMSYDPSMSHYRRVHAPSRHYLPCQLSIAEMHRDYLVSAGSHSHEIDMKEVKLKNISFAKLGEEGSENCLIHNDHK